MIADGDLPGLTVVDIPTGIFNLLMEDSEYAGAVVDNVLMGLFFAALGMFGILKKAKKETADTRVQDL